MDLWDYVRNDAKAHVLMAFPLTKEQWDNWYLDSDKITKSCGLPIDHEFDELVGIGGWGFWANNPPALDCEVEITRRGWHGQTLRFTPSTVPADLNNLGLWWRRHVRVRYADFARKLDEAGHWGPVMSDQKDKSGYRASDEPLTDRSCVRCAYYRAYYRTQASDSPSRGHRCERPQFGVTRDYVVGEDIPNSKDAYEERRTDAPDTCGPEGKFWSQSGF